MESGDLKQKNGATTIANTYDYVTEFNRYGFAGVRKDDKWAIANEKGELITDMIFYFGEGSVKPEFLGKYYRTSRENGEIYYTNEIDEDAYYETNL